MKVVIVTTAADVLGGVFAQAYRESKGPPIHAVLVLADRRDLDFPYWAKALVSWRLFGVGGTFRLVMARVLGRPLPPDRRVGLHRDWLSTLAWPETQLIYCRSINEIQAITALETIQPDLLVSIGAPVIFKQAVLEIPRIGAINVHNGRLPKYRGHFGTFWEVQQGERWAYTCIHQMATKVDAGAEVAYHRLHVDDFRTFLDLMIEKKRAGGALLANVVQTIAREDSLPERTDRMRAECEEGYFGWPTLVDIRKFSWSKRMRG